MLILSRRPGETLCIGDSITVTVLGTKGNQVRIGIHAPKDMTIDREEVALRRRQEAEPVGTGRDEATAVRS